MLDLSSVETVVNRLDRKPTCEWVEEDTESIIRLMRAMLSEMRINRAELAGYRAASKSGIVPEVACWLVCGNDLYASKEEAVKAVGVVLETSINNIYEENARSWLTVIKNTAGIPQAIELYNHLYPSAKIRIDKLELKTKYEPRV